MHMIKNVNADIKMQQKEIKDARKIVETYQRSIKEIYTEIKDGSATVDKARLDCYCGIVIDLNYPFVLCERLNI